MADKKLIDNSSATTVDNFYGNKSGADVQIPLATAASVLAGVIVLTWNDVNLDADNLKHSFASIHVTRNTDILNLAVQEWGYIMVIKQAYDQYLQIQWDASNNLYYIRSCRESLWSAWKKITITAI